MPASYRITDKTNRLNIILAAINSLAVAPATGSPSDGALVVGTSAFVNTAGTSPVNATSTGVLAILPLPNAGVSVSGPSLTLISATATATATASGTAANAAVINSAGTIVVGGLTVGTSLADVVLNSTALVAGQTTSITAATITHS